MLEQTISNQHSRELDGIAINYLKIPSIVLMENAGKNATEIISNKISKNDKILIFCGKGNNGGDGFVVARHLRLRGFENIKVVLFSDFCDIKGDALVNLNVLKGTDQEVCLGDVNQSDLLAADVVVDAMFGTGLNKPLEGKWKEIIELINLNKENKKVFSIDAPSGFLADDLESVCILADYTITFIASKTGMLDEQAKKNIGEVVVCDIGVSREILEELFKREIK
jgi:hydroxyethylthiazole kinase-like uncharacterized protein yjeF